MASDVVNYVTTIDPDGTIVSRPAALLCYKCGSVCMVTR